jgi:formylglycine-generating enzyme required for sulfatase activity
MKHPPRTTLPARLARTGVGGVLLSVLLLLPGARSSSEGGMPTGKSFENSIGMRFVRIEPGTFSMGNDRELPAEMLGATEHDGRPIWLPARGDYDEQPVHRVTLTRPFYLGVTEVTNEQYERFDPRHMLLRGRSGFSIDGDEAVVYVSWPEAQAFCAWLSGKEGRPYRLPTEAEWEYAARAGSAAAFAFGDRLPDGIVKNPDNSWYPEPRNGRGRQEVVPLTVGRTPANEWGLHDMHGNVEEWVGDWYGPYDASEQVDPVGPREGDFKVARGGSHGTVAFYLRSANRMGTMPEDKSWLIGFRVAVGERPPTTPLPPPRPARHQQDVRPARRSRARGGPDASRPYFEGPRPYVKIPDGSEGPLFSRHNHAPSIVECPNGDLLAVWYTTVTERGREIAVAASRLRAGQTEWDEASLFWDPPDRNDSALAMWSDGRTLYHFNSLSVAATWGPLAIILRTSDDSGATWSKARLIVPDHHGRHQVIPSVFRTREGVLVLTADATPAGDGGTALHLSRDGGRTWADAGGTIAGIHAGVTQLRDGRLFALGRGDTIDGRMPQSHSADLGRSWTYAPSPFPPIGGGQRLQLLRLREGPLLLFSFANPQDPTAVEVTDAAGRRRRISGLFAALSDDDGRTWPRIRVVGDDPAQPRSVPTTDARTFLLDRSTGEPRGYLAATQAADGLVHLISSRNHYAFNRKWLETPPP